MDNENNSECPECGQEVEGRITVIPFTYGDGQLYPIAEIAAEFPIFEHCGAKWVDERAQVAKDAAVTEYLHTRLSALYYALETSKGEVQRAKAELEAANAKAERLEGEAREQKEHLLAALPPLAPKTPESVGRQWELYADTHIDVSAPPSRVAAARDAFHSGMLAGLYMGIGLLGKPTREAAMEQLKAWVGEIIAYLSQPTTKGKRTHAR